MRIFGSDVQYIETEESENILQVESFDEIFFDVYEIFIGGYKYPVEKISEYQGNPIVAIPVVLEGVENLYPFVLIKGKFEVLFNRNNTYSFRMI